jgi:hypothetical protein
MSIYNRTPVVVVAAIYTLYISRSLSLYIYIYCLEKKGKQIN